MDASNERVHAIDAIINRGVAAMMKLKNPSLGVALLEKLSSEESD